MGSGAEKGCREATNGMGSAHRGVAFEVGKRHFCRAVEAGGGGGGGGEVCGVGDGVVLVGVLIRRMVVRRRADTAAGEDVAGLGEGVGVGYSATRFGFFPDTRRITSSSGVATKVMVFPPRR